MRYATFKRKSTLLIKRLTTLNDLVKALADTAKNQRLNSYSVNKLSTYGEEATASFNDYKTLFNDTSSDENCTDWDDDEAPTLLDTISELYVSIHSKVKCLVPNEINANADVPNPKPSTSVNLPKFDLPKFNGQYEQWVSFYNLFDSCVDKNNDIPTVSKFQYLLSCLSGEPLDIIKGLNITNENYKIALDLLKERYDNKRRIVTQHVNKILELPVVLSGSLKSIRTFLSIYHENTQALKSLGNDITNENTLLVLTLLKKLPSDLRKTFEDSRTENNQLPSANDLIKFLETEFKRLEGANIGIATPAQGKFSAPHKTQVTKPFRDFKPNASPYYRPPQPTHRTALAAIGPNAKPGFNRPLQCHFCNKTGHSIYQCVQFQALNVKDKLDFVHKNNLCSNCLGTQHETANCRSHRSCQTCSKRHHTLLHENTPNRTVTSNTSQPSSSAAVPAPTNCNIARTVTLPTTDKPHIVGFTGRVNPSQTTILLATCLVNISTAYGKNIVLRAVLDSAAQMSLISTKAAQLIGASRVILNDSVNSEIQGISGSRINCKGVVKVNIASLSGTCLASEHPCMILNRITSPLPQVPITPEVKGKLKGYVLADPCFDLPADIDFLIGADLFALTLTGENFTLGPDLPQVLGTIFGFVIIGGAPISQTVASSEPIALLSTHDLDLRDSLQRFWTLEEAPTHKKTISEEDEYCLKHFDETHRRDGSGRYIVALPKRPNAPKLGDSKPAALQRLSSVERKLLMQPKLKSRYSDFMEDYLKSGHMTFCETPPIGECYFLPHHGVFKDNTPNSKIRVVFDGSAKTSNGVSLNDTLLPGPKLQNDICDILLTFRSYKIFFCCDCVQMFRQTLIHEEDRQYQLILWRSNVDEEIRTYQLNTVTYGLTCSPFLAIRTLQQLVADEGEAYPLASNALKKSIFYDDIVAGADSLLQAQTLKAELEGLLAKGGLELRKWISNAPELLDKLPDTHREAPKKFTSSNEPLFSVLGLKWTPETDMFSYEVNISDTSTTKRGVLSTIAKLYDLPGFLTPVIFWAKAFIQHLWALGLHWDEELPSPALLRWNTFLRELPALENIRIPRYIGTITNSSVELHGFSDASEKGYAAVVYIRLTTTSEKPSLILSKSRVAPLKKISLPRLELCGAHLLGKLLRYSSEQLSSHVHIERVYAWSDSTIVLSWIRTPPYKLKVFVANRVAELQELVPPHSWNHVKSQDNPADCATRGLFAPELLTFSLWWNGPEWLSKPKDFWPQLTPKPVTDPELLEIKKNPTEVLIVAEHNEPEFDLLTRYSCFIKLVNVMSFILRFLHNSRPNMIKKRGRINATEANEAKLKIFKLIQHISFPSEFTSLEKNMKCSTKFQRLSPFVDESGIMRVGGRLKHSNLTHDAKHPVLLPKKHPTVKLLIMHSHLKYLHAGPQLLQSILAKEVWIFSARSVIRSVIFKCLRCFKMRPVNQPPLMGDLPETRLCPVRPFYHTGMDYSGYFETKIHTLRNSQILKSYLCLFVCFTTKAVHLEVVTDLSVESFVASLTRFVSRRGLCGHLYSDCGTNFVGASKYFTKTIQSLLKEYADKPSLANFLTENSIKFHFQPPAAPHQGGLWESAIKSAKYHLKRVIGDRRLTLMEFSTLVTQVEAILNSRPLTALSADPSDISALTPGHFLIGSSLVAPPEAYLEDIAENRLTRWQTVQAFHQRFWKRWHQEYLHQLQQRLKWDKQTKNLEVGDLVLIQDPQTPPLLWPLGRIVKTSPGSDGVVRVITIKTQRGTFSRPAVKVYPLP